MSDDPATTIEICVSLDTRRARNDGVEHLEEEELIGIIREGEGDLELSELAYVMTEAAGRAQEAPFTESIEGLVEEAGERGEQAGWIGVAAWAIRQAVESAEVEA